jgi:hypothetical protein
VSFWIEDIRAAWELALAVTAGIGTVYAARWYWWRVNAWSEFAAMGVAMVCTAIFIYLRGHPPEGVPAGWLRFPFDAVFTVAVSVPIWVTVTLLTPPGDREHLRAFYRRVRPGGPGWRHIAGDIDGFEDDGPGWHTLAGIIGGSAAVYGVLLGMGELIIGTWGAAAGWTGLAVLGTAMAGWAVSREGGLGLTHED